MKIPNHRDPCGLIYALLSRRERGQRSKNGQEPLFQGPCGILFIFIRSVWILHLLWPAFLPGSHELSHIFLSQLLFRFYLLQPSLMAPSSFERCFTFSTSFLCGPAFSWRNGPAMLPWVLFQCGWSYNGPIYATTSHSASSPELRARDPQTCHSATGTAWQLRSSYQVWCASFLRWVLCGWKLPEGQHSHD